MGLEVRFYEWKSVFTPLALYYMSIMRNNEKILALESSNVFFDVVTKPLDWMESLKEFLSTNPTAQRVIQTVSRIC